MALPPEPLQEILPHAVAVVEAVVIEITSTGVAPAGPPQPKGATGGGGKAPSQVVKLRITRVLKGSLKGEVTVTKPEAAYLLKAGNGGPFVLGEGNVILGRYGPDTWRVDALEAALSKP